MLACTPNLLNRNAQFPATSPLQDRHLLDPEWLFLSYTAWWCWIGASGLPTSLRPQTSSLPSTGRLIMKWKIQQQEKKCGLFCLWFGRVCHWRTGGHPSNFQVVRFASRRQIFHHTLAKKRQNNVFGNVMETFLGAVVCCTAGFREWHQDANHTQFWCVWIVVFQVTNMCQIRIVGGWMWKACENQTPPCFNRGGSVLFQDPFLKFTFWLKNSCVP